MVSSIFAAWKLLASVFRLHGDLVFWTKYILAIAYVEPRKSVMSEDGKSLTKRLVCNKAQNKKSNKPQTKRLALA
jgi:hypothetical protein